MSDLSGQVIKGYELKTCLGEGAYGAVYRAVQTQVKREVAVKIILPQFANQPDFIRRFENEAQLVAQLEHPYIVPLYDFWREPGGAYLVMRLMKGDSLENSLRVNGTWQPAEAARLVDQVAAALEAAHRQGVVHRDLKPANILLDEQGNAYLSDFGIAKQVGSETRLTQTGAILGTPAYITPEQVQSQPVTAQTDIYALGVVLYELLVGEHPFPDTPTGELVVKHLSQPLPLVRDKRPDLPPEVDQVIQKATSKDPFARYPDALSLAADFRRALQLEIDLSQLPEGELYNPYKGLHAFQESDADDFFGRDALIGQLIMRLIPSSLEGEGRNRFLAIVGPSGSGKSSVVKAGLLPALRSGALPGSDQWFIVEMLPGAHPLEELEAALLRVAVNPPASLLDQMKADKRGVLRAVMRTLPSAGGELLLVVDQFEELFTLVADSSESVFFMDSLYSAVTDPQSCFSVIVTLRADFYDQPLMHPDFSKLVQACTEVVVPLTPEELQRAIRAPAERVGAVLEDGLLTSIITDVVDQPGSLPLLQYALTELFDRRAGRMLTKEAYHSIGGVLGALGRRAEEIYSSLEDQGKQAARQLFLRLVTLGEGVEDTRRRVPRSELEGLSGDSEQGFGDRGQGAVSSDQYSVIGNQVSEISNVIEAFGRARLLTFDRDPLTREPTVEVAHEALLREWRRLREWLDESRADIRMQRVLGNAAAEWQEAGRDSSFLLHGSRLDQFEAWGLETEVALTADERAYLDASLAERRAQQAEEAARQVHEAALERRSFQRLRIIVVVLVLASIVGITLTIAIFNQSQRAQRNEAVALSNAATATVAQGEAQRQAVAAATSAADAREQQIIAEQQADARATQQVLAEEQANLASSRELSLAAVNSLETDPELSLLLALHALDTAYTKQAEEALHQALQTSRTLHTFTGHSDAVLRIAYSPDGALLATAGQDGTVLIWDIATGNMLHRLPFQGDYLGELRFNSGGEKLALLTSGSGFQDVNFYQWDVGTGELVFQSTLPITLDEFFDFDYSPDWTTVAIGYNNGTAELWDLISTEQIMILESDHEDWIWGIKYSSDGSRLLTFSPHAVTVWDVETSITTSVGQPIVSYMSSSEDEIVSSEFTADGTRLAFGYTGGLVEVWDLSAVEEPIFSVIAHNNVIADVAFNADESLLATSSLDGTAWIWDLAAGEQLAILAGHQSSVERLAFSPLDSHLATASRDSTARIWDARPQAAGEAFTYTDIPRVMDLELSPDGRWLATGSAIGPAAVWEAVSGAQLLTLSGEPDTGVYRVSFSPDGSRIATVGEDNVIRVWDTGSGEVILTFSGHGEGNSGGFYVGTLDVAYSPEGTRLATAGADGIAKVWDAETGDELLTLSGHTAGLHSLAYSPDGRLIATSSDVPDSSVKVWDAESGEEIYTLNGNPVRDWGLAFSPDSTLLATGGFGGIVKVWDMGTGEELYTLPSQVNTVGDLAFSPDGSWLVTGGEAVRLWVVESGEELLTLIPEAAFPKVKFSPDGTQLYASFFQTGVVGLYTVPLEAARELAKTRLTRGFTSEECQRLLHLEECPAE